MPFPCGPTAYNNLVRNCHRWLLLYLWKKVFRSSFLTRPIFRSVSKFQTLVTDNGLLPASGCCKELVIVLTEVSLEVDSEFKEIKAAQIDPTDRTNRPILLVQIDLSVDANRPSLIAQIDPSSRVRIKGLSSFTGSFSGSNSIIR